MKKAEALAHWKALPEGRTLDPAIVPYKHSGSTYDQDGIRITGSQEWIDQVLSKIKDLLLHENGGTRLALSYKQSTDRVTRQPLNSYNCYIQVHERGREGQIAASVFNHEARANSAKLAALQLQEA